MAYGIGKILVMLSGLIGANAAMAGTPAVRTMPVHCTVTGAKLLAPMTGADICVRFVNALGGAMGAPAATAVAVPADGLTVELNFLPQGVASARVTRLRGGRGAALPLYEMAVSDRRFAAQDIDNLAVSVAKGMATAA